MTYNEKKSLYESIMNTVSKVVKKRLDEAFYNNEQSKRWYAMYDSKYNKDFAENTSGIFTITSGNKIAAKITVRSFDHKDAASILVSADNVGILMQKITIMLYAPMEGPLTTNDYTIEISADLKNFWKKWDIQFQDFHKDKEYREIKDVDDIIGNLAGKLFWDNSDLNARQIATELYKYNQTNLNDLKVYPN